MLKCAQIKLSVSMLDDDDDDDDDSKSIDDYLLQLRLVQLTTVMFACVSYNPCTLHSYQSSYSP